MRLRTGGVGRAFTPSPSGYDRVADIYDATRSLPSDVMSAAVAALAGALDGCSVILDVGVGTGRFAEPVQALGFEVVGIDLSSRMVSKAKEKGVPNLGIPDAHLMPLRDQSVAAVTVIHVLHLMRDWQAVVREIGRVSRKKVVSVIGRRTSGGTFQGFPTLAEEYSRLRTRLGYPLKRLEDAEGALLEKIEPLEFVRVTEYTEEVNCDDEILYLENHGSSSTWGLPEDVHQKIIAELRSRFSGTNDRRVQSVYLVVWGSDQFRNPAEAYGP